MLLYGILLSIDCSYVVNDFIVYTDPFLLFLMIFISSYFYKYPVLAAAPDKPPPIINYILN